jgi:hypothetical protein
MKKIVGLVFGAALLVAPAVSFGQSQSPQDRPQPKSADQSTQKGADQAKKGGDQAHGNDQKSANTNNSAISSTGSGKGNKDKSKKGKENGKPPANSTTTDLTVPDSPGIK